MFTPEELKRLPWHEMVAFVKGAEMALFPNAPVRETATLWLSMISYERRDALTPTVIEPERQRRIDYMWDRARGPLVALMKTRAEIKHKDRALSEQYRLKEAVASEEEEPFNKAYGQLLDLMEVYVGGSTDSLELIKRGIRPKRPMPADYPADMLARARKVCRIDGWSLAEAKIPAIDRVITGMAKQMVELR